ncbi:MAG: DUF4040 domain-containing protein [Candidatus Aenigmarchaeota archaeon]|nr:DUF4040 domain-containing protein [Candidatus Aenigmarchaeota archaeon]
MIIIYIALLLIAVFSFLVIETKNFIHAAILLGVVNSFTSLSYFLLRAPDVGMTEAAVGAGLTTLVFIIALKKIGVYKE